MNAKTFNKWLQEKYTEVAPRTLDDNLPDYFDNWYESLSQEQLLDYVIQFLNVETFQ